MIRKWTTEDGLPSNQIEALARTADGYIWLGTSEGLAKFDGHRITRYGESDGISSMPIKKLVTVSGNVVWVLNQRGERYWVRDGKVYRDDSALLCIVEGPDGTVYGYDGHHLFRVGLEEGDDVVISTGPENQAVYWAEIALTQEGRVWLLVHDGLAMKNWIREKDGWTHWEFSKGLSAHDKIVLGASLKKLAAGEILLASGYGQLIQIWEGVEKQMELPPELRVPVRAADQSEDGEYWVAPYAAGLYFGDSAKGFSALFPATQNTRVLSLQTGDSGGMWAGTEQDGLLLIRDAEVESVALTGGSSSRISALEAMKDGSIAVSTEGHGFYLWKGGSAIRFTEESSNEGTSPRVTALRLAQDGALWAGGVDCVYRISAGGHRADRFLPEEIAEGNGGGVRDILADSAGGIWLGRQNGAVENIMGSELRRFQLGGKSPVGRIVELERGRFLALTIGGRLVEFDGEGAVVSSWSPVDEDGKAVFLTQMFQDSKGRIWLGSEGGGLLLWTGKTAVPVRLAGGRTVGSVLQIQEDSHGWIWVGTKKGLFGLDVAELAGGAVSASVWLGKTEGMKSEFCQLMRSVKDAQGRIYFGTTDGFVRIDPGKAKARQSMRRLIVKDVQIEENGKWVVAPAGEGTFVPPGAGFRVQFTGLSAELADRMNFRYRLKGREEEWREADADSREATYMRVPPGRYEFEVQGGIRGLWGSEVQSRHLIVMPYVWQTGWFKAGLSLLAAALVFLVALTVEKGRTRRLRESAAREHAIIQERERIARDLHDGLGAGISRAAMLASSQADQDLKTDRENNAALVLCLRNLAQDLDNTVWVTSPGNDDLRALAGYLTDYGQEFFENSPIRFRVDVPGGLPDREITSRFRHEIFQCVKESFTNALKHSGGTEATFGMLLSGRTLMLHVTDNGRGFERQPTDRIDPQGVRRNGLQNLHKRMSAIGGRAKVVSGTGGTRVELKLDLPE